MVTKEEIVQKLSGLGLGRGDNIIVHSSLKSFGRVEGGAETVIAALTELLSPEGTLVLPSFSQLAPYENGGMFDVAVTPTFLCGIIPETFWRMPGVRRSVSPTHSFAAWGKNAEKYTAGHHLIDTPLGKGSPLSLLLEDDGKCLLLGVGYGMNTFHHFVELEADAPCLGRRTEVYPVRFADGHVEELLNWSWRSAPCPITDGTRYAKYMEPYHRRTEIGSATVTLFRLRDGYQVISKCLAEGIDGFPPCSACPVRPRKTKWSIEK